MTLAEARHIGELLKYMMEHDGVATEIMIAGSVRRRKPEPKDVELVFRPVIVEEPVEGDLFGALAPVNLQLRWIKEQLAHQGHWQHRTDKNGVKCCGAGIQRLRFQGLPVDLFGVIPPTSYGVTAAIRTGPAEFNVRVFMKARDRHMRVAGGRLWGPTGELRTETEQEYFAAIGMAYVSPEKRF